MKYRKELQRLLAAVGDGPLESTGKALDMYYEICCGCVLVAEQNLQEQNRQWENAGLARTLLRFAGHLEIYGHMLNSAYSVTERMCDAIYDHPRLKLELLGLYLKIIRRLEAISGHELSAADDVRDEMRLLERNIVHADKGEFEEIENEGVLKKDPVEWTAGWEANIDDADREAYSNLEGQPRGMGFCFAFWHERELALGRLGVEWRNPHLMNPGVMFD